MNKELRPFLGFGDGRETFIRKGGVYFVKAQTVNVVENTTRLKSQERCVRADGSKKSCVQADGSKNSCVQADGLKKSCVQADGLQKSCVQADGLKNSCVQADGLKDSCVQADGRSEKSCVRADERTEKPCVQADERTEKSCARADGRSEKSCIRADERIEKSCVRADERTEKPCVKADERTEEKSCARADGRSCVQVDGRPEKSCIRADERTEKSCVRADGFGSKRSCVQADGWTENSFGRADGSEKSCVQANGSENSCVQTEDVQKPCGRKSYCVGVRKNCGVEIIFNSPRNRMCQDADVKPIVRDPMDDDRILVESEAHELSEFEKLKDHLTHIPFQPWCTSCVKGKAQSKPHKRTERIIEDRELPVIQCDYFMLKDVAGTSGLKVLSMYVRPFGFGMSTVVEVKGPTDTFATVWAVQLLNFLGLSDGFLQCDPEPSLTEWAESVKSKRPERTVIRSSPRRSHQSNGGVENCQK